MLWLAGQVFLLCLVSFLAGAAVTAVALRRKPARPEPDAALDEATEPEPAERAAEAEPTEPTTEPEPAEPVAELADPDVEEATRPLVVKASRKSMRYHTPDSPYYNRVKGDLTFPSTEEAELAGYTAWNKTAVKN